MQSQQEARCSAKTFEYEVGWITWQGDISLNGWFAIKKGGGGRWRYIIVERWHREKESGRSERARQGWNEEIYNVQARLLPNSNERLWLVGKGLDKDRIRPITPRIITHRPMGSVLSANVPGQFDLAVFAIDLTHVSRWSPR